MSRDFCQHTIQAYREIRGNYASPRAHALHIVEDRHEHKICNRRKHGKNGRNCVGQKKTNAEGSGTHLQGPKYHLLVPSQYQRGWPLVKGFRRCGLVVGRKMDYFDVHVEALLGKNALLGWHFTQKRQAKGLDHLMHAIGVGRERASNPYPFR